MFLSENGGGGRGVCGTEPPGGVGDNDCSVGSQDWSCSAAPGTSPHFT